jgi:hypothetical protein
MTSIITHSDTSVQQPIVLSDYGWFYIIVQAQTLALGYGITFRPQPIERLLEYARHVCAHQSFSILYYGKKSQIKDLERYVKSEWVEFRSDLFSDKKLEWLDPIYKKEIWELEELIHERIVNYPYHTIKRVKQKFMPLTTANRIEQFSNITTNPDFYLEQVHLTKRKK